MRVENLLLIIGTIGFPDLHKKFSSRKTIDEENTSFQERVKLEVEKYVTSEALKLKKMPHKNYVKDLRTGKWREK